MADMSFADEKNGIIVGFSCNNCVKGTIYRTSDGGENWHFEYQHKYIYFSGVSMPDPDHAIAVGGNIILRNNYNSGIPVELYSFNAAHNDNNVLLTWQTATETNNKGFEVQRKSASDEYLILGYLKGYGTTTISHNYNYSDKDVPSGNYTYRLRQIDYNGSFEYSKEIDVQVTEIPKEFSLEQNFPNPFNPATTIKFSVPEEQIVEIKIFDVLGNEVAGIIKELFTPGSYEREWNAGKISSGVYYLRMTAGEFNKTRKMILIK
jgi:hypothetical protein